MNVALIDNPEFRSSTPYFSKVVGEPPLTLAISVHQALIEAVAASGKVPRPKLDSPATPERVLMAKTMKARVKVESTEREDVREVSIVTP
jgi:xanthine dehydrogenase large subunit